VTHPLLTLPLLPLQLVHKPQPPLLLHLLLHLLLLPGQKE
jgi:hypothetical protein